MAIFYLIRHGNIETLPGDRGLTNLGNIQAHKTAVFLKRFPVDAIYTSPYLRTKETAQIISSELNLKLIEEELIKERMNWQSKNQTFGEFLKEWDYTTNHPEFKPYEGDSVKQTAHRMNQAITKLASSSKNGQIVLVTHGGAIRDYLTIFSRTKLEIARECSITKIKLLRSRKPVIEYYDIVDHLRV